MKKKVTYKSNKRGGEILVYISGMTTQDCIDIISKRIHKRTEEMKIYEYFHKKYLSLNKKQEQDINWLKYLKSNPS